MPYTTLLPLGLVLVIHDCYPLLPQPRSTFPAPLQTIQHPLLFHDYFDVPRLSSNRSPTLDSKELDLNFGENIPSASDPLRPTLFTSPLPETEFLQAPKTIAPNLTSPPCLVATIRQATYAVNFFGSLFIIQCTSSSENIRFLTTTIISIRSSSPQ